MRDLWNRLERWLEQNVPDILPTLNPGASMQEIEAIQNILGMKLPDDYVASCLIHNGQNQESPGLVPSGMQGSMGGALMALGVRDDSSFHTVFGEWTMMKQIYDNDPYIPEGGRLGKAVKDRWWIPSWIPITSDGGGDYNCLDLDPGEHGIWGQVITFIHDVYDERGVQAPSFRVWFEQLVEGLEQGSIVNDEEYGLISTEEL
jgi:cell wall assembly regulator SMI1